MSAYDIAWLFVTIPLVIILVGCVFMMGALLCTMWQNGNRGDVFLCVGLTVWAVAAGVFVGMTK